MVKYFRAPKNSLGNLDAETAATLIAAAADVALVVDKAGMVRDVAFHNEELAQELAGHSDWVGHAWSATVTVESRAKVDLLRQDALEGARKSRHVNYATGTSIDIPILFSAVHLGDGRIVAFGRDLRPMSALQQRLMNAQQSMERDYSRIRYVETRYRMLLQTATDAVMILDAHTQRVTEANPATSGLVEGGVRRGSVPTLADIFAPASVAGVHSLLATVRASGRPDDVRATLASTGEDVRVSALVFREENAAFFLLRVARLQLSTEPAPMPKAKFKLLKAVESAPDGFVVTDHDGRVVTANAAFLEMAQLASEEQARGQELSRWIGRQGVEMDVLNANLSQRGSVRLFATVLQGEFGSSAEIEISAVSVMNGGSPCYGFAIRNVGRRLSTEKTEARTWPRSGEQLSDLIGRVALKDLVRESTDVIERMCIETALEMTNDNRASAAEMLGLSRQSLYVKLRRYGLGDLGSEGEG